MDVSTNDTSSLLLDSKYSDLQIHCGGRVYQVHRVILCRKSNVFSRACEDANEAVIEDTSFDCLTLERMLQFMYQGDYTVKAVSVDVAKSSSHKNGTINHGSAPKVLPPHVRVATQNFISESSEGGFSRVRAPALNKMTAHVRVYAIAQHYEIPQLKSLSLRKLRESSKESTVNDFLDSAKAACSFTNSIGDEVWEVLLATLLADHCEWLEDKNFINALTEDRGLHAFAEVVMSGVFRRCVEQSKLHKDQTSAQAIASKQILSDLDQVMSALSTAEVKMKDVEAQRNATESDLRNAKSQISNLEMTVNAMRDELAAAHQKAKDEADALRKALKECEGWLEQERHRVTKYRGEGDEHLKALKECEHRLRKETDRADRSHENCKQYGAAVKSETERANQIFELCGKKDHTIKVKDEALKDKDEALKKKDAALKKKEEALKAKDEALKDAISLRNQVCALVNNWDECRNCHFSFDFWLDVRGPITAPLGYTLRCSNCRTRHFADVVR